MLHEETQLLLESHVFTQMWAQPGRVDVKLRIAEESAPRVSPNGAQSHHLDRSAWWGAIRQGR